MIPYHIYGHSKGDNNSLPIVWLDSSDTDSYVLNNPELVTNGDFTNNSDWDLVNSNISNGKLNFPVSSGARYGRQNNVTEEGKTYRLTFECTDYTAGTARWLGGVGASSIGSPVVSSVGSYDFTFTTTSSTFGRIWFFDTNDFVGSIDNVSVKEFLPSTEEVTSIDNKGTLGGDFDLFGSVKFANGGFESWSLSDYINYDLLEPFLPDNSFTISFTIKSIDLLDKSFGGIWNGTGQNRIGCYFVFNALFFAGRANNVPFTPAFTPNINQIITVIFTYNKNKNEFILLKDNGEIIDSVSIIEFTNTNNDIVELLKFTANNTNSGENNPLFEFRLYDKAFTLTEMQELQIELNNKYL